ncbi:MAG: hypothetical protein HY869_06225 [Chloroflexi bacterium]|nr:hypothetical protein [Chloroflexota bacterium]
MTKTIKAKELPECDLRDCRVSDVGVDQFAECLMEGPNACQHALPFGYCFLCKHPQVNAMLEKSRAAGQSAAALV